MYRYLPIRRVYAREVLDSRGNPTVEVEVTVGEGIMGIDGYTGRAIVPSGASTGKYEAVELRDGQERFGGLGVWQAVKNVNTRLADRIVGENALNQAYIDRILQEEDGTDNKVVWELMPHWVYLLLQQEQRQKRFVCLFTSIWEGFM